MTREASLSTAPTRFPEPLPTLGRACTGRQATMKFTAPFPLHRATLTRHPCPSLGPAALIVFDLPEKTLQRGNLLALLFNLPTLK
jgi:hypothetical protein